MTIFTFIRKEIFEEMCVDSEVDIGTEYEIGKRNSIFELVSGVHFWTNAIALGGNQIKRRKNKCQNSRESTGNHSHYPSLRMHGSLQIIKQWNLERVIITYILKRHRILKKKEKNWDSFFKWVTISLLLNYKIRLVAVYVTL